MQTVNIFEHVQNKMHNSQIRLEQFTEQKETAKIEDNG